MGQKVAKCWATALFQACQFTTKAEFPKSGNLPKSSALPELNMLVREVSMINVR